MYRHSGATWIVPTPVDLAAVASDLCASLGIDPNLVRIDGPGVYSLPSRSIPFLLDEDDEQAIQK
jgi:hypothetical protein